MQAKNCIAALLYFSILVQF